jgi:predicted nucleotide-binding protein (sugar kinase/HSP70/actin superfamily)
MFPQHKIMVAPKITQKTLELGSKYSPDFVCVPFKYNLGNFIEALEEGANVLIQAGGGCRYGYYAEIQEQILKDLGYEFTFVALLSDKLNLFSLYKICKQIGTSITLYQFAYYLALTIKMAKFIDDIEVYIRENIGFEVHAGSFERMQVEFLKELKKIKTFKALYGVYKKYDKSFKGIQLNKPPNCLKVGVVGELYTLMEPFSNYYIEKELAKNKMMVSRFITVSYLLFEKSKQEKKRIEEAGKYLKYAIGADGTDSVARSKTLAEAGYDGIIHIKPFGCTPEVNSIPMLQKISNDYKIPILYFSFDSQTSQTGVKTRLEAFTDMLVMRKGELLCE